MAYRQDPDLEFLGNCSSEELSDLVHLLTFDKDNKARLTEQLTSNGKYRRYYPDHKMYWEEIAEEIQLFGGNTISNLARGGKGVLYREILCDVCDSFKVKYEKSSLTSEIETLLLAKVLEKTILDLPEEEIKALATELNVPSEGIPKSVLATSIATVAQTILATTFTTTLYSTSIASLVAPTVVTGTVGGAIANTALGRVLGVASGPIGWGLSGAWLLTDIASPAKRVTVPAVIQIALLRLKQNKNPKKDVISQIDEKIDIIGIGGMGCNFVNDCSSKPNIKQNYPNLTLTLINDNQENTFNYDELIYTINSESVEDNELLKDFYLGLGNKVFLVVGLGGNVGSLIASILSEKLKGKGVKVVAVVITPYRFEKQERREKSEATLRYLKENCDDVWIFPNDDILKMQGSLLNNFAKRNEQILDRILKSL